VAITANQAETFGIDVLLSQLLMLPRTESLRVFETAPSASMGEVMQKTMTIRHDVAVSIQ
jgi:hypothetical protein